MGNKLLLIKVYLIHILAPSGPPEDVTFGEVTSYEIELKWKPPAKINGRLIKYVVFIYGENGVFINSTYVKTDSYTFKNLKPFTWYLFAVQCKAEGGDSILSTRVSKKTGAARKYT